MSDDRTYWHVPGARSWHALRDSKLLDEDGVIGAWGYCGRYGSLPDVATRIPPTAHLCGSCARGIAARTDVET